MKKTTEDEIFDLPSDFDPKIYLLLHEDVKEAGMDPARHYLDFGINENRPYRAPKKELEKLLGGRVSECDSYLHSNPETKRPSIAKHTEIGKWLSSIANKKGFRVLEIGSRSVISDASWKNTIPNCEYTGFDVLEGKNVDVVGDAHCLSEYFEPNSFDLVMSFAVFEHIAMPWIVAEEISKVLDVGGHVCIETHFSFSEHELPWHFFQFNSHALEVMFCPELGFEIIDSGLDTPIVGRFSHYAAEYLSGKLVYNLFCHSSLIAKKVKTISETDNGKPFDWRQVAKRIKAESMYPKASGMT